MRSRSLLSLGLASATLFVSGRLLAQPDTRDHRPGHKPDVHDHRPPPPPQAGAVPTAGPTEAPPPPREEKAAARAGFTWIAGRWDWRAGKWEWVDGHWERERAGKHWRAGRWDHKGDAWVYVDGEWTDESRAGTAAAPPAPPPVATTPPPAPPMPDHDRPHHEWKLDRPVISSYWPVKGKVGSRIVIRGRNFAPDMMVVWGDQQVAGASVKPEQIVFVVPAGAVSGAIALRRGHGRDLPVGIVRGRRQLRRRGRGEEARGRAPQAGRGRVGRAPEGAREGSRRARRRPPSSTGRSSSTTRDQRRADRVAAIRAKWEPRVPRRRRYPGRAHAARAARRRHHADEGRRRAVRATASSRSGSTSPRRRRPSATSSG